MDNKELLKATHQGDLDLDGYVIEAYNLDNNQRVLSRIGFLRALGRTGKAKGGRAYDKEFKTPVFLSANNLKPLIDSELIENSKPIFFKDLQNNECIGYDATLLPKVVYLYASAYDKGILKTNQIHIGERCEKIVKAFLNVAITSLVDEATGYQYDREAKELQKIFNLYISEELLPWQRRFPDVFYMEIFRLRGWSFTIKDIKKRPGVIGTWTNNLIYKKLPKGVLQELKRKTPKTNSGNRKHRFHQLLTLDIGHPDLQRQLTSVITIMKLSKNWDDFMDKFNQLYGQTKLQFPNMDKK